MKRAGRRANLGRTNSQETGEPSGGLALAYAIAGRLIFSKVKPAINLGRASD